MVGYLYCLRFDRGVVHGAVVGYLYCLKFDRGVVHGVVDGYLYCLRFDRGVVHGVVALLTRQYKDMDQPSHMRY